MPQNSIFLYGGDERVRTSAPCYRPNCLANSPLHHLGTSPNIGCQTINSEKHIIFIMICLSILLAERVGFEPTVRYKRTPIFKTGAINQLDHLSVSHDSTYINTLSYRLSRLFIIIFYFLFYVDFFYSLLTFY